jgi:hypothetical protein
MSLEMAHKVIVPQKKIMSRSFLNSGTLIVKRYPGKIIEEGKYCVDETSKPVANPPPLPPLALVG